MKIIKEDPYKYPDLWYKVYIPEWTDPGERRGLVRLLAKANCLKASNPLEADIVVFGGGVDVDPLLYKTEPHSSTTASKDRDQKDLELFALCYKKGIPMVGICRGAQFGHVMAGGSLYQDVNNHYATHDMYDIVDQVTINKVSSVHHQACMPDKDLPIRTIGVSSEATMRWLDPKRRYDVRGNDVEAFDIPEMAFFGVQGHPEYSGYPRYSQWWLKTLERLMTQEWDVKSSKLKESKGSYRLDMKNPEIKKRIVRNGALAKELS